MVNPDPYSKEAWLKFVAAIQSDRQFSDKSDDVEFFLSRLSFLGGSALSRFREEVGQNPKRFASEFGSTYQEISSSLNNWGSLAEQTLKEKVWDSISRSAFFGLNGDASYTEDAFRDDTIRARRLLELVRRASREALSTESEKEEKKRPSRPTDVFQSSSKKESNDSQQASKPQESAVVPQVPQNSLQESVEQLRSFSVGDKKIRQEIVRSQQMVLRQLANAYGVPEKDQNAFVQELAADLTPVITHEFFSMGEKDLAEALKGTNVRYAMYRKVLMRAQQSPQFQASLGKALQSFSPSAKGLSANQIEEVAVAEQMRQEVGDSSRTAREEGLVSSGEVARVVGKSETALRSGLSKGQNRLLDINGVVTPDAVVGRIQTEEAKEVNGGALADQDIQDISRTLRVGNQSLEANLRQILYGGAGLTESQANGIIARLQAHALLGSNVDAINPLDFEKVLGEGLGEERLAILPRISRAMKASNLSWGNLASAYVRSAKIDVVSRTGNSSAMYSDSTREPSQQLINQMQKEVFSRGFEATSLGLYAPESALAEQLRQLEAGQPTRSIASLSGKIAPSAYAGAVVTPSALVEKAVSAAPEPKERLRSALGLKRQAIGNLVTFSRSKQSALEKLEANGFSKETYQEIHWNEKVEYIRSTITQQFVSELSVDFVIPEQEFLLEIVVEGPEEYEFYAPNGQPAEYNPEFLEVGLGDAGEVSGEEGVGGMRLRGALSDAAPALRGRKKKSRKKASNKKSMLQAKASAAKQKLQQRALMLALAAIPGGQALLPLVKAGFVAMDAMRKLPGGEKIYRAFQNILSPDKVKENLKRAFLGTAALGAAGLAATIAYLSQLGGALLGIVKGLGVLGATGAGFLIGNLIVPGIGGMVGAAIGFVGSGLALYGGQIASGLQALFGGAAAGFNSALSSTALAVNSATAAATGGIGAAAQSAVSGIQSFFGSIFGTGSTIGFISAPVIGAAVGVAVTGVALNQDVLRQAFLTERKPISISSAGFGGGSTGLNQPGCWPASGEVLAIENYCNDGSTHKTLPGSSAIDISAGLNTPVYAPFGGTAYFYPDGGYRGSAYGVATVLKADNGATFIFAHLRNHGNFQQFEGGSAVVLPGDLIGRVNSTGNSDGNHLHYEVIGGDIRNYLPDPSIEACRRTPVVSACQP